MPDENPIVTEPTSAAVVAVISLSRHLITGVGAYAIAKGWLDQSGVDAVLALSATALPAMFSVYSSYQRARALKAAAPLVPNAIIRSN